MTAQSKFFLFITVFLVVLTYSLLNFWRYFQPGGLKVAGASNNVDWSSLVEDSVKKKLTSAEHRERFILQFFQGIELSEDATSELKQLSGQIDFSKKADEAVKAIFRFTDKHVDSLVIRAKIKSAILDRTRGLRSANKGISELTKKLAREL